MTRARVLQWILVPLAAAVVAPALFVAWLLLPMWPAPDFAVDRGSIIDARETGEWTVPGGRIVQVEVRSSTGLAVEMALRLPDEPLAGRPLLIMLGGQETGRAAVELLPDTRGVAVAALSYPFGVIPHRDGWDMLRALGRIQRGILDTPTAALLATDYLLSRPDLDPGRVEMAGISFGAFVAAIPAALDDRVERLWLIHGSGDPQHVIAAGLRKRIDSAALREAVAWLLAAVAGAHHLSPEYWVGEFAPRPVIVVNAREDTALTPEAVAVLHGALERPFEILWSPGDHVHPKRPETIDFITELLFSRISAMEN